MSRPASLDFSKTAQQVGDLLRASSELNPDSLALIEPGLESISYRELSNSVGQLKQAFAQIGVRSQHRAGLVMPNASSTAAVILGVLDSCTLVPLNPNYRERELESLYERTRVDVLVTSESADHPCQRTARAKGIAIIEVESSTSRAGCFELKLPATNLTSELSDLAAEANPPLVLHTSGSTAAPKIVPLRQDNLLASVRNLVESLQLSERDRCLNMMPMFHIGGLLDLLLAPLAVGASVICPPVNSGEMFFRCLQEYSPTWYQGVPTMLKDLVSLLKSRPELVENTRPLRLVRSVSSALPNRLLHEVESLLATTVIEIYGMTESAGVICSNPLEAGSQKQGSVGLPRGCEIRIVNSTGVIQPDGERGEVVVKGASIMPAYESRAGESEGDFVDGFFRTGDEGYLDAGGYLYLCGRIKEMINRGGEKISPLEIDRVAEMHPGVQAAAAFPISHPSLGEEVGLAIIRARNAQLDEAELLAFLEERLSQHKLPRRIFYPAKLPRAAGGKLQRHLLPDLLTELDNQQAGRPRVLPETALARELAALWEATLDVRKVGMHDNFFDLGGDSLSAAAIMSDLARRYPSIQASILYEHPTLAELEKFLQAETGSMTLLEETSAAESEILEVLRRFMAAWKGTRLNPQALIIGRNVEGNRTPLFWCVNGYSEFASLASQMDAEQPVYGLRSLFDTGYKSDSATLQLARVYFDELRQIQPRGPYLLGGFCEGGKIAFLIAQMLRARGETVASLLLQEQFVASPYSGRVAIFICKPGRNNPYYSFADATRGWRKYYSGDVQLYRLNSRHKDCYLKPDIEFVSRQVQREMQRALAYQHDDRLDQSNQLQRLPLDAYRAQLEADPPTRVRTGSKFVVNVDITNVSSFDWMPTALSGLVLAARWLKPGGETRVWMAGVSEIPQILHPGESMNLPICVRAPMRIENCYLELDLVDDGVSWFGDMGSQPDRHLVSINLLAFN